MLEINIILSFILTWAIGLLPPILIRYVFLKQAIEKKSAIGLSVIFWLINLVIFIVLRSDNKTHAVLFLIAFISYNILRKDSGINKIPTPKFKTKKEYDAWKHGKIHENKNNSKANTPLVSNNPFKKLVRWVSDMFSTVKLKLAAASEMVKSTIIFCTVMLFVLGVLFYWYEYRPTKIRIKCEKVTRDKSYDDMTMEQYEFHYNQCLRDNGLKAEVYKR